MLAEHRSLGVVGQMEGVEQEVQLMCVGQVSLEQKEQTCLEEKEELLGLEVENLATGEHRRERPLVLPTKRSTKKWLVS